MLWVDKIQVWLDGHCQAYPSCIKKAFYYETSPITREMNTKYMDAYVESSTLPTKQNFTPYKQYFKKKNSGCILL